ncbi:MAG: calcium/sodium antiporter [Acidimicrobiia bacterium]|nr:MAG: calcium/sodium antiporter [Acidimicrobiia bacterium]
MWLDVILLVGGMIALIFAADRLVRSAVAISRAFGMSAVLIGAVIIGFGTSVPEFVVSGLAAVEGELDLAVANVVSSNFANVTLVLGAAAVVSVLVARRRVIRREGALMLAAVMVLTAVLADRRLAIWEGLVLFVLLGGAIALMLGWSKDDPDGVAEALDDVEASVILEDDKVVASRRLRGVGGEIIIGLVALAITVIGANFMLDGVIGLGERFGLSVVALGLVTGVGTSLPELAAALASARRRQPELALGNVLGSNIFNSLGVVGLVAVLGPGSLDAIGPILLAAMVAAAVVAGVFAYTGWSINRLEGAVLLVGFVVFTIVAFR